MAGTDTSLGVYLTPDEVSALLKIPRKRLLNWRNRGVGPPSTRFGREVRYRQDELEKWIQAERQADAIEA